MSGSRGPFCLCGAGPPCSLAAMDGPLNLLLKQDVPRAGRKCLGRKFQRMPLDGTLVTGFFPH